MTTIDIVDLDLLNPFHTSSVLSTCWHGFPKQGVGNTFDVHLSFSLQLESYIHKKDHLYAPTSRNPMDGCISIIETLEIHQSQLQYLWIREYGA